MEEARGHRSLYKTAGAPPWKETYRKRCAERLRNSRSRHLDRYRRAGGDGGGGGGRAAPDPLLVQEVMEVEWRDLRAAHGGPDPQAANEMFGQVRDPEELAVLEEIQQELMNQELSLVAEYEQSVRFDERCLHALLQGLQRDHLICPVCSRYNLSISGGEVVCQCGLHLLSPGAELTEQKLRACLEASLAEHNSFCSHQPHFSVSCGTEEAPSLFMSCQACESWTVVL
ncbi:RPA-interacting protein isoform X2 [Ornithorhynchus anatinus]|uniref:RPA interacting protein n=1 Tax=Ornithorhynchus anatinus TaxID=9258 RepID=F7AB65_ORNAN|nr:RPA-interacting protein isoform X2 [Ornithorhynchus anatinus]